MLITLLPQNGIGNYSAPNPINYRAGCARARSSFSISTPNYSARVHHSERQIERNFRHGDGENRRAARLSWVHPTRARGGIDGDDVEDDGPGDGYDDAGHGDAGDVGLVGPVGSARPVGPLVPLVTLGLLGPLGPARSQGRRRHRPIHQFDTLVQHPCAAAVLARTSEPSRHDDSRYRECVIQEPRFPEPAESVCVAACTQTVLGDNSRASGQRQRGAPLVGLCPRDSAELQRRERASPDEV